VKSARSAFTLPELLTVLAVVVVLAAILFPVFRSAKASAYRTTCASNFRQVQIATLMYLNDYDDRFMPVNHFPALAPNPKIDRTWVQLLLPYVASFPLFKCPSDYARNADSEGVFDESLVLGDTHMRYYYSSLRVNVGYNYLYYSPVLNNGAGWEVQTRSLSQVNDAARALLFVDSVYGRTKSGAPYGGGSYVVIPPCRFYRQGRFLIDSFDLPRGADVFVANRGWNVEDPNSPFRFGLAWPWHDGRMNMARVGGGTISITTDILAAGCDLKPNWMGIIDDNGVYFWDWN